MLSLPTLLAVVSCGARPAEAPADAALQLAGGAGRQAMDLGRLPQAAEQYRKAYDLAVARDDAQAIGTYGYDLAVVELASNDAAQALLTARRTRDALAVREAPDFAALDLVQSATLYRLGRDREADAMASRAQADAGDPDVCARASYIRGLIADRRGDVAGLANALAHFGPPETPPASAEADRDDLSARLALIQRRYSQAAALALRASDIHRMLLDYRAMSDTLALAAEAKLRAGLPQEASDLFLQASESAEARGDKASATRWLTQSTRPPASLAFRAGQKQDPE